MLTSSISPDYQIKSTTAFHTYIEGYASVFGISDYHNDVIIKGAFHSSLQKRVKLLWQHDVLKPIGVVNKLYEDDFGLKVEAEINNRIVAGSEASELIKQKAVDGLSIGFSIKASEYNNSGQRLITDIELFEISIVTFPANYEAQINQIKNYPLIQSKNFDLALNKLEQLSQQLIENIKE